MMDGGQKAYCEGVVELGNGIAPGFGDFIKMTVRKAMEDRGLKYVETEKPTKMKAKLKKVDRKLLDMALGKAEATGNDYVMTLLKGIDPKKVTVAERDLLNDYLGLTPGTMMEV